MLALASGIAGAAPSPAANWPPPSKIASWRAFASQCATRASSAGGAAPAGRGATAAAPSRCSFFSNSALSARAEDRSHRVARLRLLDAEAHAQPQVGMQRLPVVPAHAGRDALADFLRGGHAGMAEQDREFVAAEPGDDVALAHAALQQRADGA